MASDTSADSPFHAKQIVFLFMAATVVAVVVFLCGVLVGRGVPLGGTPGRGAEQAGLGPRAIDDLPPPPLSTPRSEPSAAARNSDDLTYPGRLSGGMRGAERVGDAIPAPTAQPAEIESAEAESADAVADVSPPAGRSASDDVDEPSPASSEPASEAPVGDDVEFESPAIPEGALVVQVIALKASAPAKGIAEGLVDKGFQAFVLKPFPDEPVPYFRVRVGPFADKADAERISERLRAEEGLVPYIVP